LKNRHPEFISGSKSYIEAETSSALR